MVRRTTVATAAVAALSLSVPVALGAPALAAPARSAGVHRSGTCSLGSTWRLSVKPDNGRLEVQAEIHSIPDWVWHWKLSDNGVQVATGSGTTGASSGSFFVTRKIKNRAGKDHVTLRATYLSEVCKGAATF